MVSAVYQELKRRIVLLDLPPGIVLNERELAAEFEVSRTPIREALIRLEAEGLVRILPNRGMYVSEVSFKDIVDVSEVRSRLVGLAAQLAVKRITDAELDSLSRVLARIESETSVKALWELDLAFHDTMNRATHNTALVATLEILRNRVSRIWAFTHANDNYFLLIRKQFRTIFHALERRDSAACEEELIRHIKDYVAHIDGIVEGEET